MGKKILLIFIFCLTVISILISFKSSYSAVPTPEKPMEINYDFWLPTTEQSIPVIKKFLSGLENATHGAVRTKLIAGGAMGPGTETYDRVLSGVSHIGHFGPGFTPGVFPMFSIFDNPIRVPSAELLARAQIEIYKRGYLDKEFSRVKVISLVNIGPYVLYTSKRKVTALEDFKGLKIRCPSEGWVEFSKLVGAIPVSMASGEVYIALQKGITDANLMPWSGVINFKLGEVSKYVTELLVGTFNHLIVMNKKTWESLPQEGKDYIEKNWMNNCIELARAHDAMRLRAMEVYSKIPGREIVNIPPEEWKKIDSMVSKIWTKWISENEAKGFPARKVADELYKIMTDLGIKDPIVGYSPGK